MRRPELLLLALLFSVIACEKGATEGTPDGAPASSSQQARPNTTKSAKPPVRTASDDPHARPHGAPPSEPAKGPPRDVTPSGKTTEVAVGEMKIQVPEEWEVRPPSSDMRLAELVIPGPGGDAELAVFRFPGGAGGVQANIDRWKGQFQPPEGKSIDDVTEVTQTQVGDAKITLVDVSGRFVAPVRPGAAETLDEPDYRMLAAIVEGKGDPFFFKATGPAKTLALWSEAYEKMFETITFP